MTAPDAPGDRVTAALAPSLDAAFLPVPTRLLRHPLGWLAPPAAHAVELLGIFAAASVADLPGALSYALLAVLVMHHYDVYYRVRAGLPPGPGLIRAGLGWDGRLAVVVLAAALGVAGPVCVALTGWCGALFTAESVRAWVGQARAGRPVVDLD